MTTQADKDFQEFESFHKSQLDALKLPQGLHRKLF